MALAAQVVACSGSLGSSVPASPASLGPPHIYWANWLGTSIGRANLDGTNVDQNFIAVPGTCDLAIADPFIFWVSSGTDSVGRARLDGAGVPENLIRERGRRRSDGMSPIGRSCSVATRGSYIYWGNGDSIGRARLDGSEADSAFIVGASNVQGIAVASKYIYWTNAGSQAIGRAEARWQRGRPDLHTDRLVAKWHRNWRVAYLLVQLQSPYHRARQPRRLRREPEFHPRCAPPGRRESRLELYLLVRNQYHRAGQPGRKRHQPRLHLRGDDSARDCTSGALSVVGRGGLEPPPR